MCDLAEQLERKRPWRTPKKKTTKKKMTTQ
jgi:hypothetical protein